MRGGCFAEDGTEDAGERVGAGEGVEAGGVGDGDGGEVEFVDLVAEGVSGVWGVKRVGREGR